MTLDVIFISNENVCTVLFPDFFLSYLFIQLLILFSDLKWIVTSKIVLNQIGHTSCYRERNIAIYIDIL